jgi:WD40 repeat protein
MAPGEWELNKAASQYMHVLGYDAHRKNNIHSISKDVLLYAAGKVAVLYNQSTQERVYIPSLDGGGIGCCSVHPSGKYFVVGEKCSYRAPNIYIYEYPSLKLHRVLTNGTEVGYADLGFSVSGEALASVGGSPDYMLTIWNWETETTMLRTKAFGQDVHRVCFSVFDDQRLITGGTGHIKFWKMASTFTGLKLKVCRHRSIHQSAAN